jgi:hypothetical protein
MHPCGVGAKLQRHLVVWERLHRAYLITRGLAPEWKKNPPPNNVFLSKGKMYTGMRHGVYMQQLQDELREGIVRQVTAAECRFLSPAFLVPKKGGEWRKVLDCRQLNKFIADRTFQMEDARTAAAVIEREHFAVSIDIKTAYHHIPVAKEMQPYLCFRYGDDYFQYLGMPFGIKNAPRIFTRIMHQTMAEIRERWHIACVKYLDDLLFLHTTAEVLQRQIIEIADLIQEMGWTINWDKSQLVPTQQFLFLGIEWDTTNMEVRIEKGRTIALQHQVRKWMRFATRGKTVGVRSLAKLIGQLSQTRIQHRRASLYLVRLNRLKVQTVNSRGWNTILRMTPWVLGELQWWSTQLRQNRPTSMRVEGKVATIYTDASPQGWGGWMEMPDAIQQHQWTVYGVWKETMMHTSNYHETMARCE